MALKQQPLCVPKAIALPVIFIAKIKARKTEKERKEQNGNAFNKPELKRKKKKKLETAGEEKQKKKKKKTQKKEKLAAAAA